MRAETNSRSGAALWLLAAAALTGLAIVAPPAGVMALFGMLPTVAATMVNWRDDDSASLAVAGMNVAGLLPVLTPLLRHGPLAATATGPFGDILSLITVYVAAAFGWTLVGLLPAVSDAIGRALAARQRKALLEMQRQLIEEWGPDARGGRPAPPRT